MTRTVTCSFSMIHHGFQRAFVSVPLDIIRQHLKLQGGAFQISHSGEDSCTHPCETMSNLMFGSTDLFQAKQPETWHPLALLPWHLPGLPRPGTKRALRTSSPLTTKRATSSTFVAGLQWRQWRLHKGYPLVMSK